MDVYLDAYPIGRSKLTVIHRQFRFPSLNCPFGLRPFERPCALDFDASKHTNMYRPFGQNLALKRSLDTVYLDHPNTCMWTVHLDDSGTYNWMVQIYVNWLSSDIQLDGPNIRSLTVQMDNGPMDCQCYVNLDRPNRRQSNGPPMLLQLGPSQITVVDRYFGLFKNTVVDCNFGLSKIRVGDRFFVPLKGKKCWDIGRRFGLLLEH